MNLSKKNAAWVLVGLLVMLAPFIYLVFFAHPIADDLVFGYKSKTHNFWELTQQTYLTWNGRYSGNFFIYLFPVSIDNLTLYRGLLLANIILLIIGFYYFFSRLFYDSNAITKWSITFLSLLTYISITANIAEAFYWFTSVVYYQLSLSLFLIVLGLIVDYNQKRYYLHAKFHVLLILIIEFVLVGLNETMALTSFFLFMFLFVWLGVRKKQNFTFWLSLFIVAFLGLVIVVFSPGNENRMANYVDNEDLFKASFMGFLQVIRFTIQFVLSFSGLFYFLFIACFYKALPSIIKDLPKRYLILSFLVVLFLCAAPSYFATGMLGQHRTMNVAALFFVILLTLLALKAGKELSERLPRNPEKMVLYFVIFFFVIGNGRIAILDLYRGDAQQYSDQLNKRYVALKEKKSTKELYRLSKNPKSLFIVDIKNNDEYWVDKAYLLDFE